MSAYALDKLADYPEVLQGLRETGDGQLISVHLMPQNLCNQRCEFCSYRLPDNKNSVAFNEGAHLSLDQLEPLLDHFEEMGVRGVEVTGGGEPLAHPEPLKILRMLAARGFAIGLVTNGTLHERIKPLPPIVKEHLKWVRVSIDASREETYRATRKAPKGHFEKAWGCVRWLAAERASLHEDFRLGVGFVLANQNAKDLYSFVAQAKAAGADNVRLSSTFSDQHEDFFKHPDAMRDAVSESLQAVVDYQDENFTVHNLIPDRNRDIMHPYQDYRRCPTKDLLCVVEGEGRVYTCCTFTGSLSGLYGNYLEHPEGFKGLWEENATRRREWDSREECRVSCLYRDRNVAMNRLIDSGETTTRSGVLHREFI